MKSPLSKSKLKEMISYGVWGVMTVLFSLGSYAVLSIVIADFKIANLISIVLTKVFAYVVNKKFVFHTKNSFVGDIKELLRFIVARGFTGIVDWIGQIILVDFINLDDMISKAIMVVITTILNYILSSVGVFNKNPNNHT